MTIGVAKSCKLQSKIAFHSKPAFENRLRVTPMIVLHDLVPPTPKVPGPNYHHTNYNTKSVRLGSNRFCSDRFASLRFGSLRFGLGSVWNWFRIAWARLGAEIWACDLLLRTGIFHSEAQIVGGIWKASMALHQVSAALGFADLRQPSLQRQVLVLIHAYSGLPARAKKPAPPQTV